MSWEIADRNTLAKNVTEQILLKLKDGTFKPGDTLPSQQQLARMLRVGVPVVREALQRLEALGIVEVSHGRRTRIRSDGQELLIRDPESFLLVAKKGSLDSIWEARHIVESGIAVLAAQRATQEDLDAIQRILEEEVSETSPDFDTYRRRNNEFHMAVAEASHNPMLIKMLDSLLRIWLALDITYLKELLPRTHEVHKALFEAIRQHDPEAATRAVAAHTAHSMRENFGSVEALFLKGAEGKEKIE